MKQATAVLGLVFAAAMTLSMVGTSEAQSRKPIKPPKDLTTGRFVPYPITVIEPAKDRRGNPVIRGKRQKFWVITKWATPERPNSKDKKHIINKRVLVVNPKKAMFCSTNCARNN